MSRRSRRRIIWYVTGALVLLAGVPVWAQDSISKARDLYTAAAYEDALAVLNRLRATDRVEDESRTIDQYRAFCLLALGRAGEAERAIEAIIAAQPMYAPSVTDVSPRVRAAFVDVRRRMLPMLVQQKYAHAKAAFDRKEFGAAAFEFKQILEVLADPDLGSPANLPLLSDLRTLSAGFHELSVSAAAPPSPPPAPPSKPEPVVVAAAPDGAHVYDATDGAVVPPIAMRQALPPYPRGVPASSRGVLEIIVDERGDVESAVMRGSLHPTYDTKAIAAAKTWQYTPATLDGVPVKYRRLIQIALERQR